MSDEFPYQRAARLGLKTAFLSLRFGGPGDAQREARLIRDALYARNIIVTPSLEGDRVPDRLKEIMASVKSCDVFVVFAKQEYGEDTGNPMCSFEECKFARRKKKKFAVINMCGGDLDIEGERVRVAEAQRGLFRAPAYSHTHRTFTSPSLFLSPKSRRSTASSAA